MTATPDPTTRTTVAPRIIRLEGDRRQFVAVSDHGGDPEWWCKACQAWHPIHCPNDLVLGESG